MITEIEGLHLESKYMYLIIIVIFIVLAYAISYIFEIHSFSAITVMLIIIITSFYAFGIIPFEFLGVGYLIFAIMIYAQIKNRSGNIEQ